jgi:hypothetical protein
MENKPETISDDPLMIAALKAVDKIIEGLASSDFVTECGGAAIKELGHYRIDMAADICTFFKEAR